MSRSNKGIIVLIFSIIAIAGGIILIMKYTQTTKKEISSEPEKTIQLQVAPNNPVYTLHMVSLTKNADGYIDILESGAKDPFQRIIFDQSMPYASNLPQIFVVTDINFDGYLDIGVKTSDETKKSSYQYWIYDIFNKTFITTEFTIEFENLSFDTIQFDDKNKKIITTTSGTQAVYTIQNGHLQLQK